MWGIVNTDAFGSVVVHCWAFALDGHDGQGSRGHGDTRSTRSDQEMSLRQTCTQPSFHLRLRMQNRDMIRNSRVHYDETKKQKDSECNILVS